MLSKKMAVSLTSLIIIFALAFVVPIAMGAMLGDGFETKLSINHRMANTGTNSGPGLAPFKIADNVIESDSTTDDIFIKVEFAKTVMALMGTDAEMTDGSENAFTAEDITVTVKDQSDRTITLEDGHPIFTILTAGNDSTADAYADATGETLPATGKTYYIDLGGIMASPLDLTGAGRGVVTVEVKVLKNRVQNYDLNDRIQAAQMAQDSLGYNAEGSLKFTIVPMDDDRPTAMIDAASVPAIVLGPTAHPSFSIKVTLSEPPAAFSKDHIEIKNAMVDAVVKIKDTTYTVVIKPKYETKDDIEIRIKPFERKKFPRSKSVLTGASKVKVNDDSNRRTTYGTAKNLTNKAVIPMDGYLVVAKDKAMSFITDPGNHEHGGTDLARRVEAKLRTYNLVAVDLGIDLEGFLVRGGTIDLISPDPGLVITEIMWATDGGSRDKQWIEIKNTSGAEIKLGDGTHKLMLYEANEVLPDVSTVEDRVSTLYKGTNHWSILGKGQSGRTDEIVTAFQGGDANNVDIDIEVVSTAQLISMERVMDMADMYADGTMESSWGQSNLPSQNFMDDAKGLFVGSPGASPINPVMDPPPKEEMKETEIPPAMAGDIAITEIMVDTGSGRLPQWIELTNTSGAEKSLAGWSVEIENAAADADVVSSKVSIKLSGTLGGGTKMKGEALLLVAWAGRSSANLSTLGDRLVDVSDQVDEKGRYTLLSPMGFLIELLPPQTTGIVQFGDAAGNLDADVAWDIPMDDTGRSSLIRVFHDGILGMGTDGSEWRLASSTSLIKTEATWYGSDEDAGTPGVIGGGPLPVELSHFRPARDKATGQVVITWATQSELNNAGFFIKRSQQRDGEFQVINATMIAGAGTTSEKQTYTYTDTTAQPNIVYYYQIEDVSFDGNRQTLTNGIRLKGHIGAAGKLTSTWGELKSSNE